MEEQSQERRSEENRQEELFRMIEKKLETHQSKTTQTSKGFEKPHQRKKRMITVKKPYPTTRTPQWTYQQ